MQIFGNKIFEKPIEIIEAFDNKSFIESFYKIEDYRKRPNIYLLGYIRYEAKEIFLNKKIKSKFPLLYFEVFDKYSQKDIEAKSIYYLKYAPKIKLSEYTKTINYIRK